jgi:hypothetical protein
MVTRKKFSKSQSFCAQVPEFGVSGGRRTVPCSEARADIGARGTVSRHSSRKDNPGLAMRRGGVRGCVGSPERLDSSNSSGSGAFRGDEPGPDASTSRASARAMTPSELGDTRVRGTGYGRADCSSCGQRTLPRILRAGLPHFGFRLSLRQE